MEDLAQLPLFLYPEKIGTSIIQRTLSIPVQAPNVTNQATLNGILGGQMLMRQDQLLDSQSVNGITVIPLE